MPVVIAFGQNRVVSLHRDMIWNVGAGTFNPATFLRVLGPEPWIVAYVRTSRRPTDGDMAIIQIDCSTIINIR